jgi:hypothetical protein
MCGFAIGYKNSQTFLIILYLIDNVKTVTPTLKHGHHGLMAHK